MEATQNTYAVSGVNLLAKNTRRCTITCPYFKLPVSTTPPPTPPLVLMSLFASLITVKVAREIA